MNHSREIRQLFQIADEYFKSASALRKVSKNHLNQKSARIAKYYEKGMPTDSYKTALNLLLAHLSSAAVRLVTIDERFKEDHNYAIFLPHENECQSGIRQTQLKKTFVSKRDQYMHQFLRHNISHIERSKNSPRKRVLWYARQDAIESLSVDQIFNAMSTVIEKFRKELIDKKIL